MGFYSILLKLEITWKPLKILMELINIIRIKMDFLVIRKLYIFALKNE